MHLEQLAARLRREREIADKSLERAAIAPVGRDVVRHPIGRVAGNEPVGAESLAVEETGA
jgi:hypothetical protein